MPTTTLIPVYQRLLESSEVLPALLLRRMLDEVPGSGDANCLAALVGRTDVSTADADKLFTGDGFLASEVADAYLTRPDATAACAGTAVATLSGVQATRFAGTAPSRAVHVELLRQHAHNASMLVALAGNETVDLATRHAALSRLSKIDHVPDEAVRVALRALPVAVRALAAMAVMAGTPCWMVVDLALGQLPDDAALHVVGVLARAGREEVGWAADVTGALRSMAGYLSADGRARLRAEILVDSALLADTRALVLLDLSRGADLVAALGELPWAQLMEASRTDEVWAKIGGQLTALLLNPDTAAVLASLSATVAGNDDVTVAGVLGAVAGVTATHG